LFGSFFLSFLGVKRVVIGENGLLSTPAVSAIIREKGPIWQKCYGALILTASHNPGGPEEDFGIKYNCENGGPAPERLTEMIYSISKTITSYRICNDPSFPIININEIGKYVISSLDNSHSVIVEVISSVEHHVNLLKTIFDFQAIHSLLSRSDFSMKYDCMSGVQGKYAHAIFINELGCSPNVLLNAESKEDFGGHHADPNLTYAHDLCEMMGVDEKGNATAGNTNQRPSFGAACDGDADRNMILGTNFFVTPSDSLAIITAYADTVIPYFREQGGLKAVARSMPTSGAVDLVARNLNISLFETPTGWKFFGNVMDSKTTFNGPSYNPMICGEESFGTGSDHIREKDGMWAVLAWLSILAHFNRDASVKQFVLFCLLSFLRVYHVLGMFFLF
jgi:phosphoglucomutase